MAAPDKRQTAAPRGPRVLELVSKPPTATLTPITFDNHRRNPVKLTFKPNHGESLPKGSSGATSSNSSRVVVNGNAQGFGLILSNSTTRHQPSATVEKAFELDMPSSSQGSRDHAASSKGRDASDAYPTPNTPPLTAGTSSPARASSVDDDNRDRGPVPPPPTEPAPPVPTPPPFDDVPTLDAPPSPPPTDRQPSPIVEDPAPEPEREPDPPRGPTPPPPFETLKIQACKTIYDPKIEGLASKDKGKALEKRHNGEVPEGQPPVIVVDPRLKMSDEQKYGMKGRRPLRPKLYSFTPYEVCVVFGILGAFAHRNSSVGCKFTRTSAVGASACDIDH